MNCPWCDARPNDRPCANPDDWECNSFVRGKRRYQTDACRVRVADKQIEKLRRQRDALLGVARRARTTCTCESTMRPDLSCLSCRAIAAVNSVEGEQK